MTYAPTLLTAHDRVRLALGDTDTVIPLLPDATVDAAILRHGEAAAVAVLAEGLAARFAQEPDSITLSGLSIRWGERVKSWLALASRSRVAVGAVGVSVETYRGEEDESEYVRLEWWIG